MEIPVSFWSSKITDIIGEGPRYFGKSDGCKFRVFSLGISIMQLDEKMDHGPILVQEKISVKEWQKNNLMEKDFAEIGAEKFFGILEDFLEGKIIPESQNHEQASYCQKYQKSDMELEFPFTEKNARKNFLKYCAFLKPFYFDENKKRTIVTAAH